MQHFREMFFVWKNKWWFIADVLRDKYTETMPIKKYLIYM